MMIEQLVAQTYAQDMGRVTIAFAMSGIVQFTDLADIAGIHIIDLNTTGVNAMVTPHWSNHGRKREIGVRSGRRLGHESLKQRFGGQPSTQVDIYTSAERILRGYVLLIISHR